MIVLLVFAVLAGAGTALSPCVLPVLPALLSASGVGGRRRPLGIVLGLSLTLAVTIVGLANVVGGVGEGSDVLRDLSIAVLVVFGVTLLVPALSDRIEAPLSRLARFGPARAATASARAARGRRARLRLHTVRLPDPGGGDNRQRSERAERSCWRSPTRPARAPCCSCWRSAAARSSTACAGPDEGPALQRALGVVMILTAVVIAGDEPERQVRRIRRQRNPQRQPHRRPRVLPHGHQPPAEITGHKAVHRRQRVLVVWRERLGGTPLGGRPRRQPGDPARRRRSLPMAGTAPEFTDTERWFNTPGDRPL